MTIIQKINNFIKKKKYNFLVNINTSVLQIHKFSPLILISFVIIFSVFFFITSNFINHKNTKNLENLEQITEAKEFSNLTNFIISKINSPYEEKSYVIQNIDTM